MRRRPTYTPVSTNSRKGASFAPRGVIIGAAGGVPPGPNQLAPRNPDRIAIWIKAPANNSSIVYLGDSGVAATASAPGTPPTLGNSWELEPGESVLIDDTIADLWAVAPQGFAGQVLKVIEQTDVG
jgi:hypothetical protein